MNGGQGGGSNVHGSETDIFHHAAATLRGFDTEPVLHGVCRRVFDGNVAHIAGHFTADGNGGMGFGNGIVSNDDGFCRLADTEAVLVSAGFEHNGVITGVERAVFYEDIFRRVHCDAVGTGARTCFDGDAANDDVLTVERVNGPHRTVFDMNAFDKNSAAIHEFDKCWTQRVAYGSEDAITDRNTGIAHLVKSFNRLIPFAHGAPPNGSLSIDGPFAGYGDIEGIGGIERRRIIVVFDAFKARKHHRKIFVEVGAKENSCAFLKVKVDIAREMNGTGEPYAHGNANGSAAQPGAIVDSLSEGFGIGYFSSRGSGIVGEGTGAIGE